MEFTFDNLQQFENWRYNLLLVAPGKGEAKKTVSRGFIRLELWNVVSQDTIGGSLLQGAATDDILSISTELPCGGKSEVIWVRADTLKNVMPGYFTDMWMVTLKNDPEFDAKFDKIFWEDHVLDSISGEVVSRPTVWFEVNPDRFRKFSLLRPNTKITFDFVEWADRDIIRWYHNLDGIDTRGVYVPAGRGSCG